MDYDIQSSDVNIQTVPIKVGIKLQQWLHISTWQKGGKWKELEKRGGMFRNVAIFVVDLNLDNATIHQQELYVTLLFICRIFIVKHY